MVTAAFAQSTSSLSGVVTDPTGAVLAGVTVTLVNTATGTVRTNRSNKQGQYQFSQVMPGSYRISAVEDGFTPLSAENIQLLVNTPATINLQFSALGTAQTVTVSDSTAQLNTTNASLGNTISQRPIIQLPLEGRNVTGLLALQPGVTFIKEPLPGTLNDYRSGAVNGGKSDQANVLLDGVDSNDLVNRQSFTSVLRVPPDSIEEFRTITANPGAELGFSSGAQVTLITRGGTNMFHGALYEYNRNTELEANNYLNKIATPIIARPALIRNVFGGAVGGPIRKDRLFFFANYEGRRDASATSQTRIVPTALFRVGTFSYLNDSKTTSTLTPAQVQALDPQGIGEDPTVLSDLQKYPLPNASGGDGYNTEGYKFNAKTPLTYNTYVARIDWHIDSAGRHEMFWRGNLQTDNYANGAPQFPGQPSSSVYENFSKGFAVGYDWVATQNLVNSLRVGFTRESVANIGTQTQPAAYFDAITPLYAIGTASSTQAGGYTTTNQLPTIDIRDDVTWTKGKHTVGFGGEIFLLHNHYNTNSASFSDAYMDGLYVVDDGGIFLASDAAKSTNYEIQFANILGLEAKLQRRSNYDLSGATLPEGTMIHRDFDEKHFDLYLQDSWKVSSNLILTGGVRDTMSPPIYDTNGFNVSSDESISKFYETREQLAASGQSQALAGNVTYDLDSTLHKSLYNFQNDLAPRVSFAFSPSARSGFLRKFTGGDGMMSVRGGYGLFYDAFGQGMVTAYSNAVGFSTLTQNGPGQQVANIPRYTGFNSIPFSAPLFPPAVAGGFPQTPAPGGLAQASTIDSDIHSPYSMVENLTVERQFAKNFTLQVSWVGRQSRHSLIGEDVAAPTDLYDAASGMDYYQAARIMANYVHAGATTVPKVAYWEDLWPGAATSSTSATQGVYNEFKANPDDWTSALLEIDNYCTPSCSKLGPNTMFNSQFAALYAFRSIGMGDYNGLQVSLHKSFSQGYQFDFNYTYSKCLDLGSSPESGGSTDSTGSILNSWDPSQMHAVCDYDLRHQISAFGIWQLPFGTGKAIGSRSGHLLNEFIGGWQLTTLFRTTTGFPASVTNGVGYPTVWDFTGYATLTGKLPAKGPKSHMFANNTAAYDAFSATFAGESGSRNVLRGDGLITLDAGVDKRFELYPIHGHPDSLQFRFEGFNVTNTARFDPQISNAQLSYSGNPLTFGNYQGGSVGTGQLIDPRVFQAVLRWEF